MYLYVGANESQTVSGTGATAMDYGTCCAAVSSDLLRWRLNVSVPEGMQVLNSSAEEKVAMAERAADVGFQCRNDGTIR